MQGFQKCVSDIAYQLAQTTFDKTHTSSKVIGFLTSDIIKHQCKGFRAEATWKSSLTGLHKLLIKLMQLESFTLCENSSIDNEDIIRSVTTKNKNNGCESSESH